MIGRREFLTLVTGTTLAWPAPAPAQQPALPVVGFLHSQSPETFGHLAAAFRDGLAEAGYADRTDVTLEYRWADGQTDRLPALAAELVELDVAVIFAGAASALAAQASTSTIPIVFVIGADPVAVGLVASLNRPGGNLTGVTMLTQALEQKRLGLLHELLPAAMTVAVLVNPTYHGSQAQSADVAAAAPELGLRLRILTASTEQEIDAAFATMAQAGADALLVAADPFFNSHRDRIVSLAAGQGIPAIYEQREFAIAGGLMSYGTSLTAAYRQAGLYVARVLDGEAPADLPVIQSGTFEFVLNLRTAAALGIQVPPSILVQATELIE